MITTKIWKVHVSFCIHHCVSWCPSTIRCQGISRHSDDQFQVWYMWGTCTWRLNTTKSPKVIINVLTHQIVDVVNWAQNLVRLLVVVVIDLLRSPVILVIWERGTILHHSSWEACIRQYSARFICLSCRKGSTSWDNKINDILMALKFYFSSFKCVFNYIFAYHI